MARRRSRRKSSRRSKRIPQSNSSRLFKSKAKCPASIKRVCKTTKKGQLCRVTAGSFKSKWTSAGVAQRRALNLKARLAKAKKCSPPLATSLGRYRRSR